MLDFNNLQNYRENNLIEAKNALGGLPESIWETYSAFANTEGGVILLGVEEEPNRFLHTVDLPDPDWLIEEFWSLINDPKIASANILREEDVQIKEVEGDHIIVINVPKAEKKDRPIYIYGDPISGSYYRSGDGDIRFTPDAVKKMLEEAENT